MALAGFMNGGWTKDASLVPARLALGSSMLYHGASKLRGDGPRQAGEMFESLGLKPGRFWATATGAAEAFAGAAALLGIATRPAALAVLVTQAVAVAKVHRAKGYDVTGGGMEYNLRSWRSRRASSSRDPGGSRRTRRSRRRREAAARAACGAGRGRALSSAPSCS